MSADYTYSSTQTHTPTHTQTHTDTHQNCCLHVNTNYNYN